MLCVAISRNIDASLQKTACRIDSVIEAVGSSAKATFAIPAVPIECARTNFFFSGVTIIGGVTVGENSGRSGVCSPKDVAANTPVGGNPSDGHSFDCRIRQRP